MVQVGQFTIFLINAEPQKPNTTVDILTINKLMDCTVNQWNTAELNELQKREIQQDRVILEEYEEKMKKEKVIREDDELYRDEDKTRRQQKKTEKKQSRKWESFAFGKTGEDNKTTESRQRSDVKRVLHWVRFDWESEREQRRREGQESGRDKKQSGWRNQSSGAIQNKQQLWKNMTWFEQTAV